MKSVFIFIIALLFTFSINAKAAHTPHDYKLSPKITYTELVQYIDSLGWDTVFYSQHTETAIIFVKGQIKDQSTNKLLNAIFYYWKPLRLKVDKNNNAMTDLKNLQSALPSCCGPSPSQYTIDANASNLVFDLDEINKQQKSANSKLLGFRLLAYASDTEQNGQLGEVIQKATTTATSDIQTVLTLYPYKMAFRWLLDDDGTTNGLLVDSAATGAHTLDQFYKMQNYNESIHGASFEIETLKPSSKAK